MSYFIAGFLICAMISGCSINFQNEGKNYNIKCLGLKEIE